MGRALRSSQVRDARFLTGMVVLTLLACSKNPTRPIESVESPTAVVKRFRAAWVERDTLAFRSCLATNFTYASACADRAGDVFFEIGPNRDSTMIAAARLFRLGSAGHPAALSIDVRIDSLEVAVPRGDLVHERHVLGTASVVIRTVSDSLHLGGLTGFDLVRGDVELATEPPDSTRWFIRNWIDVALDEAPPSSPSVGGAARRARQLLRQRMDAGFRAGPPPRAADAAACDSLARTVWGYALRRYLE